MVVNFITYNGWVLNNMKNDNLKHEKPFDNLRKLLHDKYGYDGIIYRNNIEDRGSDSYIAFYPEQVEFVGNYEE